MKTNHYLNVAVSITAAAILIILEGTLTEWILLYGFISFLYYFKEAAHYFSKTIEQQALIISSIQEIKQEIINIRDSMH